jgi:chorismate mutase
LSDAAQQLTPAQFIALVGGLELPREDSDDAAYHVSMVRLRNAVDDLDGRLLDLLGERMRVVREMGIVEAGAGGFDLAAGALEGDNGGPTGTW